MKEASVETIIPEATLVLEPKEELSGKGSPPRPSVTIAGPGRLGQAIGKLLNEAGYSIRFVAARRAAAARLAARFIGSGVPCRLDDPSLAEVEVILLTVADEALSPLAAEWATWKRSWRGKIVLHTSGALPAAVLEPLKKRGASIGSMHPFQTVPSPALGYRSLPNSFWAIEGDARACRIAIDIAHALDGLPFRVEAARKTLYHAGAVMSCGAVVAMLDHAERMLRSAGVPARIIRPMLGQFVSETIRNYVALGGRGALTGPAVRGDWHTFGEHFRAIRRYAPGALPVYREVVRAMTHLAGRKLPRGLTL
jgi:predicted short-subunit dehydrogenase-like oxidoreductase (DUF2520 family)